MYNMHVGKIGEYLPVHAREDIIFTFRETWIINERSLWRSELENCC